MRSRIVALLLIGMIGLSLAAISQRRPRPLEELTDPRPVEVTLATEDLTWQSGATLVVNMAEGPHLVSNGRPGLVTEIHTTVGVPLTSGDPVVSVDGSVIRTLATRRPLYREIRRGTRGDDVADLQAALADLSLYDGDADGTAGTDTMRAVAALLDIDFRRSTTLSPLDVLWLPVTRLDVGRVDLEPGTPVPPVGTPIVAGAPTVAEVVVTLDDEPPADRPQEALRFESLDGSLIVDLDADLNPTNLRQVESALAAALSEGVPDPPPISMRGVVTTTRPRRVIAAPTTAVVVDGDDICVWSAGASPRPRPVQVVGSSVVGVTFLADLELDGSPVVANPVDLGLVSCSP